MSGLKILGLVLLVAGILALVYGGFTYTEDTHEAKLGPLELEFRDRERINVPTWAGAAGVVAGVLFLVVDRRR